MTVRSRISSAVAVIVLLTAACSSDEPESQADQSNASSTTSVSSSTTSLVEGAGVEESVPTSTIPVLESDFGVDETSIRIGLSVDLSGPLSGLDSFIVDAHLAYFDEVNDAGGIAGRSVEVIALDHASDIDAHVDNVRELLEQSERGVAMIASVGGDDFAAEVLPVLEAENALGISRGHAFRGAVTPPNLARLGEDTCIDAYAGVLRLAEATELEVPTLAIVSRQGVYGTRSTAGALAAAEEVEAETVFEFRGELTDESIEGVAAGLVSSEPDLVWLAVSPSDLRQLLLGVAGRDNAWLWGGTYQSYDPLLLETSVAATVSTLYTHTASVVPFGDSSAASRSARLRSTFPATEYWAAESLSFGWQQAELAHEILLIAAEAGDLTRAAIVNAHVADLPDFGASRFFSIDHEQATLRAPISEAGSTGLNTIDSPLIDRAALQMACGAAR
jgi:ABC-type branched-subunit amino acid transport system substrate-binding protein